MINKGFFLITDISGYTQFLTDSELIHANEILQSLFQAQLKNIKAPFRVNNYQGDAIQTYAMSDDFVRSQMILEMIENIYFEFQNHLLQTDYNTTCECTACSNIKNLDLKFFIHYGEFLILTLGDRQELQGPDVIMAHRLMKNTVSETFDCDGYALFTQEAIEAAGITEFAETMTDHIEEYEHIGQINVKIYDLEQAWQEEQKRNKKRIEAEDAWVSASIEVPAPKSIAWDYLTDIEAKRTFLGMNDVFQDNLIEGRIKEDTKYHCVHDTGDIFYSVIDWSPFDYFTTRNKYLGMTFFVTYHLIAIDETHCRFECRYSTPQAEEYPMPLEELHALQKDLLVGVTKRFSEYVSLKLEEGAKKS